jgi:[lysine-biosynthesis-protein LysW]---L-2-aminoadipate ligase
MSGRMLAVFASRVRVEEKAVFRELDRAAVAFRHIDTRRFVGAVDVPDQPPYGAALIREISHTRGLYAARLLKLAGVRSVNSAGVIEVCGDKLLTSIALVRDGVPTPRTVAALGPDAALAAIDAIGYPVVLKPLTGSWGRLLAVIRDAETAQTVLEHRAALPTPQHRIVYVQELIRRPDRDIRVITVGGSVLGAVYRRSGGSRTNVARGASVAPCTVSAELQTLALRASRAVGGGILGIDVVEDHDGRLHVLEVNHTVEFAGFQAAQGDRVDVAAAIAGYVRRTLGSEVDPAS